MTKTYFMDLEQAKMFVKDENKKYGIKTLRRDLENRYRLSIKRIQIEDNGIVTIYNPNASSLEKRLIKDGWALKNHYGMVTKEEV